MLAGLLGTLVIRSTYNGKDAKVCYSRGQFMSPGTPTYAGHEVNLHCLGCQCTLVIVVWPNYVG